MKYTFIAEQLCYLIKNEYHKQRLCEYIEQIDNRNQITNLFDCNLWSINLILSMNYLFQIDDMIKLAQKADYIYKNILENPDLPEKIKICLKFIFNNIHRIHLNNNVNNCKIYYYRMIGFFIINLSNHDINSLISWYKICVKNKYIETDFEYAVKLLKVISPPK